MKIETTKPIIQALIIKKNKNRIKNKEINNSNIINIGGINNIINKINNNIVNI